MRGVRLHDDGIRVEDLPEPRVGDGEVLVAVRAAAITRDELDWPTDRLPAIPSYELSGVVEHEAGGFAAGEEVFGLTAFDHDGVAAELAAVPSGVLVREPASISHAEAAALPLAGSSAWQALFEHGALEAGERVLVTGAVGGVGHLGVQLARWRGAHVVAQVSPGSEELALELGASEILGDARTEPLDLVVDTAGGDTLADAVKRLRDGGRVVSVAEEPVGVPGGIASTYFVVEPNRGQLERLAPLVAQGELRVLVDSTFALEDAAAAFERTAARGKRGKVVLLVGEPD